MGVWREESVVKFEDIIASLGKGLLLKCEVVMSAVVGPVRGKLVGILNCTTSEDLSTECNLYQTNQEQHCSWIYNATVVTLFPHSANTVNTLLQVGIHIIAGIVIY